MQTAAPQVSTEKLNYTCNIEPSNNDTVSSAVWTITPTGPTVTSPTNVGGGSTVRVGPMPFLQQDPFYILDCHIVGASGQEYDGGIRIPVIAGPR